ncbi:hypothetical protein TUM4438_10790 [Shewanella sairae]|uniref:DUF2489 domain-containing protein n=1 Tax=Shewanella sairae TaxID=190310 RepID=A0ABQ4P606_9GAMM|nr:hypothetical protein [Shewanella sairae]MCL1130512.1 hypothetical protein [Shewanella sairae]GIU42968.1 hypothetical protein TUM4438_10790 [Shewanella sairae]
MGNTSALNKFNIATRQYVRLIIRAMRQLDEPVSASSVKAYLRQTDVLFVNYSMLVISRQSDIPFVYTGEPTEKTVALLVDHFNTNPCDDSLLNDFICVWHELDAAYRERLAVDGAPLIEELLDFRRAEDIEQVH